MVTSFNRSDLISFGNYLLSEFRKNTIIVPGEAAVNDWFARLQKATTDDITGWLRQTKHEHRLEAYGGTSKGQIDPLFLSNGEDTIEVLDCILSLITRVGRLELQEQKDRQWHKKEFF